MHQDIAGPLSPVSVAVRSASLSFVFRKFPAVIVVELGTSLPPHPKHASVGSEPHFPRCLRHFPELDGHERQIGPSVRS